MKIRTIGKCVDCPQSTTHITYKRCRSCYLKYHKTHPNLMDKEEREKIRQSKLGENNPMWKGDKVKYGALHDWIKFHKPKAQFCQNCGIDNSKLDLANISGQYLRDLKDFEWLCRRCHTIKDRCPNRLHIYRSIVQKIDVGRRRSP